ncbi:MAG: ROK family protein [Fidelibacterota bacterium]|nr:MAG: ROK family protein [Candidatus Neomarinimicrobiota bacterium]
MAVIAVDLGGTKIATALLDEEGNIHHKDVALIESRRESDVGILIIEQIQAQLTTGVKSKIPVKGIGVSVPGIFYVQSGRVWAPNIPGWDNYPLLDELASAFESTGLRITLDSDRACYILGETWLGAAKGCRNAIFIAVGTGIGAGIMVEGQILRGHRDISGAIGWLALDRPFQERYISCGCFEYYASGEGIARMARRLLSDNTFVSSSLQKLVPESITAHNVFETYAESDPLAIQVLNECVELWGMAAANLVSLFNPEKIIFGGGIFGPAAQFLDRIREEARLWAQPISIEQVSFEVSTLGIDAGLLGAGSLVMRSLKNPSGSSP